MSAASDFNFTERHASVAFGAERHASVTLETAAVMRSAK